MDRTRTRHQRLRNALAGWLPLVLWMILIYWLSAQPTLPRPRLELWEDLFSYGAHGFFFGVLSLLAWRAIVSGSVALPSLLATAPLQSASLIAALYGIIDEVHQSAVPGRHASIWDWLADVAGALMALGLLSVWRARESQRKAQQGRV